MPWVCLDCKLKLGAELSDSDKPKEASEESQGLPQEDWFQEARKKRRWSVDHIATKSLEQMDDDPSRSCKHIPLRWKGYGGETDTNQPFFELDRTHRAIAQYYEGQGIAFPQDKEDQKDVLAGGNIMRSHLMGGYSCLIPCIQSDVLVHPVLTNFSATSFPPEAFEILASIPFVILRGICGASLRARKSQSDELIAHLARNRSTGKRPCIYVVEFVDNFGIDPTLRQMKRVVERAYLYADPSKLESIEYALKVDRRTVSHWTTTQTEKVQNGHRAMLPTGTTTVSLLVLLDQLSDRLRYLGDGGFDLDTPLPSILRDIGYSDDGNSRLIEHEKASSNSNQHMRLFAMIAQCDSDLRNFEPFGEVTFLCFRPTHARVAETMFSVIAQSYTWYG